MFLLLDTFAARFFLNVSLKIMNLIANPVFGWKKNCCDSGRFYYFPFFFLIGFYYARHWCYLCVGFGWFNMIRGLFECQISMDARSIASQLSSSGLLRTRGLIGGNWIDAYDGQTIKAWQSWFYYKFVWLPYNMEYCLLNQWL